MPNFYILVGPPGVGKSTWCANTVDGYKTIRINRDELRKMLMGKYVHGHKVIEPMVTEITFMIAELAFTKGLNVVLDNTNCNVKTIRSLIRDCPVGVDLKWIIFDVPFWKQRWRIWKRWMKGGVWIPRGVSVTMNRGYAEVVKFLKVQNLSVYGSVGGQPHT